MSNGYDTHNDTGKVGIFGFCCDVYLYLHSAHKYSSIKYALLNSYHWYHLLIQKKPILAKQQEKNRSRIILQRFASVYAICRDIFFSSVSFSSRRTFMWRKIPHNFFIFPCSKFKRFVKWTKKKRKIIQKE